MCAVHSYRCRRETDIMLPHAPKELTTRFRKLSTHCVNNSNVTKYVVLNKGEPHGQPSKTISLNNSNLMEKFNHYNVICSFAYASACSAAYDNSCHWCWWDCFYGSRMPLQFCQPDG